MLAKRSLKTQFIAAFALILVLSVAATIATYALGYYTLILQKRVLPANHYELQIPAIAEEIRARGAEWLKPEKREALERRLPLEGIAYQVMDTDGVPIYGTMPDRLIDGREALFRQMNMTFPHNGKYIKLLPLIDAGGKIEGAVALAYTLTLHYGNAANQRWTQPLFVTMLFSPFIYILFFTWLFARKLARDIGRPLSRLQDAANQIQAQNLDFHLDCGAPNELGRLCEAFNAMKEHLRTSLLSQWKAEEARQTMVAALAHDLKTPLTVIAGYAEALEDMAPEGQPSLQTYARKIKENAQKGAQLIKAMLDAAVLEQSPAPLACVPIDLSDFLSAKIENYEPLARTKSIRIRWEITGDREAVASADRPAMVVFLDADKLERILDNIVSNGMRYTPEGGTITLQAHVGGGHVRFTICDSGPGFSGKDLAHLFNKFYRGDEARSTRDGHAGLGLYLARKMAEMHGGTIRAYNAPGGGACVDVVLKEGHKPSAPSAGRRTEATRRNASG